MIDVILNRLQRAMLDREADAKRAGKTDAARVWAEAVELVQEEKRRAFGSPKVAASA
jgi:hypothetical protein